jgi:hypothetical protein
MARAEARVFLGCALAKSMYYDLESSTQRMTASVASLGVA